MDGFLERHRPSPPSKPSNLRHYQCFGTETGLSGGFMNLAVVVIGLPKLIACR